MIKNNLEGHIITMDPTSARYLDTVSELNNKLFKIPWSTYIAEKFLEFKLNKGKKNKYKNLAENSCTFSHTEIVRKSLDNNNNLLIVEDDIILNDSIKYFEKYLEYLEYFNEWDLFYFYNTRYYVPYFNIIQNGPSCGTHFYIINKNSKLKIFNLLQNDNRVMDIACCKMLKRGEVKLWSTGQQLASQCFSKYGSDIANRSFMCKKSHGVYI